MKKLHLSVITVLVLLFSSGCATTATTTGTDGEQKETTAGGWFSNTIIGGAMGKLTYLAQVITPLGNFGLEIGGARTPTDSPDSTKKETTSTEE